MSEGCIYVGNARLIDGSGELPSEAPQALLIEGERIVAVAPQALLPPPPGAQLIDARGMTLMPGMIDCHDHLANLGGGMVARALPMTTCLWIGGLLQAGSNLVFAWLAYLGTNYWALTAAIIAENFTGAIGTVIFVAYLSALCKSPLHTATQFALLTALAAVGRTYLSSGAGYVAQWTGWPAFFVLSALVALPSFALLAWLQARGHFNTLGKPTVVAADD